MDWGREIDEEEIRRLQEAEEEEIPRGWRPSQEMIGAIQKPREVAQLPQDYPMQGDAAEIEKLASSFEKMKSTDSGRPIADAIREHNTTIKFGTTDGGAIAQFAPTVNEITIHESLKDASPAILAAHMAHEGTHVQWDQPDSIDQEYHAFKAQAEVWDELKEDQADRQCDFVSEMIAKGEAEAKAEIRQMYSGLPEYYYSL